MRYEQVPEAMIFGCLTKMSLAQRYGKIGFYWLTGLYNLARSNMLVSDESRYNSGLYVYGICSKARVKSTVFVSTASHSRTKRV